MTKEPNAARLLDARAVAALLNCSQRHVYRMSDAGVLPGRIKLGRCTRWDLDAIRKWLDAGCRSTLKGRA